MKKIFIILLTIFMLSACDQIIETIEETTDIIINYFVDIEPSKTTGTENTEFAFTADTNDVVASWIIDGAIIPADYARSAADNDNDNDLIYSFSSGIHTIGVLTTNGATDEVEIIVSAVDIVFNISAVTGENTTEIYLDYPLLTIDEIEYNIETTTDLNITETESQNIVYLNIAVDNTDSFCFINNNAMEVYNIDLQTVTVSQMHELIMMWFPERYEVAEPEIPYYDDTRFNLSGYGGPVSDTITAYIVKAVINGEDWFYSDHAVYINEIRRVVLTMQIDNKDSFLFINNNMYEFFGIDISDMSYSELIIAADILNRYPEEGLSELMEVY